MPGSNVLDVFNVTKHFGWLKKITVLDRVSFNVSKGEVIALLGPNGAGKTSAIKIISGLIIPDLGHVLVKGINPGKDSEILKKIGIVLEGNRNLYWRMTAAENLMYFGTLQGQHSKTLKSRVHEVLERFGLYENKNQQVRFFSRGMMQKLSLARCWLNRPEVIILDEPTLGLDVYSINELLESIKQLKEEGVAIIIATHNFDIAERISDRVLIMEKGRIIRSQSTPDLLKSFSSANIVLELAGDFSSERIKSLQDNFDVKYRKDRLVVSGDHKKIYELIPKINPERIHSMQRDNMELSDIFQRLTEYKS